MAAQNEIHLDIISSAVEPAGQNGSTDAKDTRNKIISTITESGAPTSTSSALHGLVYGIDDMPPWYTTIILGLQHFMTSFGGNVSTVFILSPYLCIDHDARIKSQLIGTMFFVTGIVTLVQCTFGVRLPILQGSTFAFLVPTIAILKARGECLPVDTEEERRLAEDDWLSRIREIQGAIMVASCVQVVVGATGIVGILMNFIGPLTITPTITLIGLSLHKSASAKSGGHWGIAIMTMGLIIIFSQFLCEVGVPFIGYSSRKKLHLTFFKLFKLFPIILAIAVAWLFCFIFTITGVFPDAPNENNTNPAYGYLARTDLNGMVLEETQWFRIPYPGQWGLPILSLSGVLGIVAGVLASIVESIGDYYACARMSGAPSPPKHAINRGILVEGIGCILAGACGTGNGTTSHSENIGAIGLTKVGSRVVVQTAGCIMVVMGLLGKFSGIFASIPDPIIGGVTSITFGMVTAVGLSNLQFIDLNSSRNLFIVGFSILMGLVIPHYLEQNPGVLKTGSAEIDQILSVILSTGMFVGGFLGILLDNTIKGTSEERGFAAWRKHIIGANDENTQNDRGRNEETREEKQRDDEADVPLLPQCYDMPFGMRFIRRWAWCQYLPFSPTFKGFKCRLCKKSACRKKKNNYNVS